MVIWVGKSLMQRQARGKVTTRRRRALDDELGSEKGSSYPECQHTTIRELAVKSCQKTAGITTLRDIPCGYRDINFACTSGCSARERCRCTLIGLRKYNTAWTIVAVIDAKAKPYEMANVALRTYGIRMLDCGNGKGAHERKRGLYSLYACSLNVESGLSILERLYDFPDNIEGLVSADCRHN